MLPVETLGEGDRAETCMCVKWCETSNIDHQLSPKEQNMGPSSQLVLQSPWDPVTSG